jgi:hypothetical protein
MRFEVLKETKKTLHEEAYAVSLKSTSGTN